MFNIQIKTWSKIVLLLLSFYSFTGNAQVIISQYYEGTGTNKWIELTNLANTPVNMATAQLKLGIWAVSGSTGAINITGAPTNTFNLTSSIPARGTVLIGNSGNSTEVPYLTAASASETNNTIINFNGNDGIALLDNANNIIDQFGHGINATDISYVRNVAVSAASATYVPAEWASASISAVGTASKISQVRLGYQLYDPCTTPSAQPTGLSFNSITSSSMNGSFAAVSNVDEYLIVQSTFSSLSAIPADGTEYNFGNTLGNGTVIGRGSATTFSIGGLTENTGYYYYIFSINSSCSGGPLYLTTAALTGSQYTNSSICATPATQPGSLSFGSTSANAIAASFAATTADEYLVIVSTSSSLSATPSDGIVYNAGNSFGGGMVVSRSASVAFSANGLNASTPYYFYIFSVKSNCTGGPMYLTTAPLTGSRTTNAASSGALNYYFGNLHAHSSYSDGNADDGSKTPADNYNFAKTAMCMDFLGISEHNHIAAGMSLANWAPGRAQAAAASTSSFVGLYGMEWGVISGGGHVIVYGVDSLIGWDAGQHQIYVPKSVYTGTGGLFDIINRHGGNALAYLAHPVTADFNNLSASYDASADEAIVGSTVETGPAFSINTSYTEPGSSMSYLTYYRSLLARGYHVGPTIDHDNHNLTFGKTTKSRLAILAPSLSENDLLDGMRRMRFYASQDCNAQINFSINSQAIGSILTQPGSPSITVSGITTAAITSIKIMFGVPGSGTAATQLTSISNSNSFSFTDAALANNNQRYYYLDITEADGSRIITSPIWYTRDDLVVLASPTITSFFTVNEKDRVVLKWTTANEGYKESFTIERSVDMGRTYQSLGALAGKGFRTNRSNQYALYDLQPFEGVAFYRLVQTIANGEQHISDIKTVNRASKAETYFTVYPNPVQGILTIRLQAAASENTNVELFDMAGRKLIKQPVAIKNGEQQIAFNMSTVKKGTYILKINAAGKLLTQLVNKF